MKGMNWIYPQIDGNIPGARLTHQNNQFLNLIKRWYHAFCVSKQNEIFMLGGFKGRFLDRQRAIYKLSCKKN